MVKLQVFLISLGVSTGQFIFYLLNLSIEFVFRILSFIDRSWELFIDSFVFSLKLFVLLAKFIDGKFCIFAVGNDEMVDFGDGSCDCVDTFDTSFAAEIGNVLVLTLHRTDDGAT